MAYDLQQQFAGLTTQATEHSDKGKGYFAFQQDDDGAGAETPRGDGGGDSLSVGGSEPASEQPAGEEDGLEIKADLVTALNTFDNTPTPPIDVPNSTGDHSDARRYDSHGSQGSRYYDEPSLPEYMSRKRPLISFDPEVKLDGGQLTTLDTPLPKLSITTRPRGRSLLEEISKREMQRQLSHARSDTDREEYDPVTGERLEDSVTGRRDKAYTASQPRWPLLQSTVDDLAATQSLPPEHAVSLTSQSTASPVHQEISTPLSIPSDSAMSPLSISSPTSRPYWYPTSPLDSPRRLNSALRSKSYGLERKAPRRLSRRSTSNSSASPASLFLARYLPTEAPPDPDAEGQEVDDYVLGREIGFGGFSTIREAYTFSGGVRIQRAVKIVRRNVSGKEEQENETLQAEFEHEVNLWRCLSHRHILPLFAVYVTEFATFAITQLNTGGTLFDAVRNNRTGLIPRFARRYAYQTASALRYLHEDVRIVHRDLKLENCLLDMSAPDSAEVGGNLLLCDFGLADYISSETATVSNSRSNFSASSPAGEEDEVQRSSAAAHAMGPSDTSTNFSGSLPYAAPELLHMPRSTLNPKADIWAYGVIAYAIVTGKLPFAHTYAPMIRAKILGGEWDHHLLEDRESGASPTAALPEEHDKAAATADLKGVGDLVGKCLEKNLRRRWDVRDCLGSKWLKVERCDDDFVGWGA